MHMSVTFDDLISNLADILEDPWKHWYSTA